MNIFTNTSVILGHQFANLQTNTANFYTAENGSYIDYDLSLEAHYSDLLLHDIFEIEVRSCTWLVLRTGKRKFLSIICYDIGFIRWDDECTNLYIDTSYHFEGISC